jgi:hypothetical protein
MLSREKLKFVVILLVEQMVLIFHHVKNAEDVEEFLENIFKTIHQEVEQIWEELLQI